MLTGLSLVFLGFSIETIKVMKACCPSLIIMFLVSVLSSWAFAAPTELSTEQEAIEFLSQFEGRLTLVGHGSKGQIDPSELPILMKKLDSVVASMDAKFGSGKWIVLYGGDNPSAEKPDIGWVAGYLKEKHRLPLFAAQSRIVKEQWGGVGGHIDFVYYVPTAYEPLVDANGAAVLENGIPKQVVKWGGFIDGKGVGPTAFLITNPSFLTTTHLLAVGGGPVANAEFLYAEAKGISSIYFRTKTRFPEINGLYGTLDESLKQKKDYLVKFCAGSLY